jgi:hypothetical protein
MPDKSPKSAVSTLYASPLNAKTKPATHCLVLQSPKAYVAYYVQQVATTVVSTI